MTATAHLREMYKDLAPGLAMVDEEIARALEADHPAISDLCAHVSAYSGKRLRPAVILLISTLFGEASAKIARLGAVVEMIHLATLVHDDVIDEASLRRGKATVSARFGNFESVLLGDIVFARAIHLLSSLGDSTALLRLTRAVSTLCEGEILQNRHRRDVDLAAADYYRIIGAKTAELYGVGAGLAAHLSGATPEAEEAVASWAYELGLAFQIADDGLDLVGSEAEVGKSLGTDLSSGKMTLPLLLLRDLGDPKDLALLRRVMAQPGAADSDRERLLLRLQESGSLDQALQRAVDHVQRGQAAIQPFLSEWACDKLRAVGEFVVQRRQ